LIFFITGTRKGIGRYLAEYYLNEGHLVLGCSRNDTDLKHQNYEHFKIDISNEKEINRIIGEVKSKYGYIDVLINNAGIASMNHFLLTPYENAKKIINTNFLGTFLLCRDFSRLLIKSKNPRIINFSTVAKPLNLEGEAIYVSSKSAVESLTKIIAKELSHYNITVNCIAPSPIHTDLISKVPEKKIDKILEQQSIKRFGKFEDVSNVIDFFIKEKSDFITGQIIYLGGIS
jgi:3-oxoacyl-[acyl-carrier protein] reductase